MALDSYETVLKHMTLDELIQAYGRINRSFIAAVDRNEDWKKQLHYAIGVDADKQLTKYRAQHVLLENEIKSRAKTAVAPRDMSDEELRAAKDVIENQAAQIRNEIFKRKTRDPIG